MGGDEDLMSTRRGPRGGTTTISEDRIRKNLWISHEENEVLRQRAFDSRRSETDLIRDGLRRELGLEEEAELRSRHDGTNAS